MNIIANTEYKYAISAINSIGEGPISSEIALKAIGLPTAPLNLRYDNSLFTQQNAFYLLWDTPVDSGLNNNSFPLEYYSLEFSDQYHPLNNPNGVFIEISRPTSLNFVHESANFIYGYTYYYRIRTKTSRGFSVFSSILSAKLMRIPDSPTDIPISTSNTNKNQIEITYDGNANNGGSPITNYYLYIDDGNGGNFSNAIDNLLNKSYTFTGLVTGKLYRIKYSALNVIGEGPASSILSVYTAIKPSAPLNLQKILNSIVEFGIINISWETPLDNGGLDIVKYNLYLNDVLFASVINTQTTYKFTDISAGINYKISVSSENLIGESQQISLTANSSILPGEIFKINLISTTISTLKVSYDLPIYDGGEPITSYDIRRDEGFGTNFLSEINILDNTFEFTGIVANAAAINKVLFAVQVRARNSNGFGKWSKSFSFFVVDKPGFPNNFRITSQYVNMISLAW